MEFPTFWARETFTGADAAGTPVVRWALGWSSTSQTEARDMAAARACRAAERASGGAAARFAQYEYGEVPLQEPVLNRVEIAGELVAAITRNRYGCLILNTDRVMFADIDLPPARVPKPSIERLLRRLFGPRETKPVESETAAIERIRHWHAGDPDTAIRVYRTFAGLRLMFVDHQRWATDGNSLAMLKSLKADELYTRLTRRQKTFRARLSPKPWRCEMPTPPNSSRIDHPDDERVAQWVKRYMPAAAKFATCRLIETLGRPRGDEVIAAIVAVHDHQAIADGKPLA